MLHLLHAIPNPARIRQENEVTAPAAAADRAHVLDALRGFAIFGILLANMQHFTGWSMLDSATRAALPMAGASHAIEFLIAWFIDGKFYSIFSLLFGIGFAVMLGRADADGRDFRAYFRRRLSILLAIGLVHAVLIWYGDILTLYALLGFGLLWFRQRSNAQLARWVVVLFALPVLQYALILLLSGGGPAAPAADADQAAMMAEFTGTMATGSWIEVTMMNIGGLVFGRYPDLLFTGRAFKVLATFLIGLYVGRLGIWSEPERHLPLLRRVAFAGFAVGIPLNLLLARLMQTGDYYALKPLGLLQSAAYGIGVPALALGYAAGFVLLHQRPRWRGAMNALLAPAGRMALTNYIAHSIVAGAIFYGWGLGHFASVSLATGMAIAVAIFVAQLLACRLWLASFSFGPAEWLWRSLTLRRVQPMRRREAAVPASAALTG
jgi:uncharacterized protein